jgi:serine/threonine-protein kinase RsbW
VRHGGAGESSALDLHLEADPGGVRVEIEDPGRRPQAVALRPPESDGGGGIGLQLVDQLATRWGVGEGPQTSVWFELDCR